MSKRSNRADNPLSHVPIFAGLGAEELDDVRGLLTEVGIDAGTVLVRQGSHVNEFFVIESGTARVERDGVEIAEVGPGDFQGEIALLDGGARTATVTASTAMTILVATHAEFNGLLDRAPTIARQMLPTLVARLRAMATDAVD